MDQILPGKVIRLTPHSTDPADLTFLLSGFGSNQTTVLKNRFCMFLYAFLSLFSFKKWILEGTLSHTHPFSASPVDIQPPRGVPRPAPCLVLQMAMELGCLVCTFTRGQPPNRNEIERGREGDKGIYIQKMMNNNDNTRVLQNTSTTIRLYS